MRDDPFDLHVEPDPVRAFALGVIQRAILDYFEPVQVTSVDKRDARLFLFAKTGPWAASRKAWCSEADIDESWLRRRLQGIIAGNVKVETGRQGVRNSENGGRPWDEDAIIEFLRAAKHLPGWDTSIKTPLANILNAAGFRAPKGGPVTAGTVTTLMQRRAEAFA